MPTRVEIEAQLREMKEKLTEKQRTFIESRRVCANDTIAAEQANVSRPSISRWKNKSPLFLQAYTLATLALPNPQRDLILPEKEKQALIASQVESLTSVLPEVVKEHVRIALFGAKEADRLRAIEKVYDATGFGADILKPVSKQDKVFVQILQLIEPQVRAIARERGVPMLTASPADVIDVEVESCQEEELVEVTTTSMRQASDAPTAPSSTGVATQ